jgi:hypothetical protein
MSFKTSMVLMFCTLNLISSVNAKNIWLTGEYHEAMTWDSMYCAQISQTKPSVCPSRPDDWSEGIDLEKIQIGIFTLEQAEKAIRFPDDPVQELSFKNPIGLIRWSWNMGIVGCEGKTTGIQQGLRCSAHYGPFQFLHAMSGKEGVSAKETKEKIMAWSNYLARIIENDKQPDGIHFIDQPYCNYWSKQLSENNPIAAHMMPNGVQSFPCVVDEGPDWTVASMFGFYCKNKIINCDVDRTHENVKRKAIGALLHMIQDSYSQGHSLRGDCCDGKSKLELAKYQCEAISQFNSYAKQNKKRHGYADGEPFAGDSCSDTSEVHDPILAGAIVLWNIKNNNKTLISSITEYLDRYIFKLKDPAALSSAGSGFESDKKT